MTHSLLNECLKYKDGTTIALEAYLHSVGVFIFDEILQGKPTEMEVNIPALEFEPKNTILYILCAYSDDSPLRIARQDDNTEKENICEYLQLPEIYRNALIHLIDPKVKNAVLEYLWAFSGEVFRNLIFMKIQLDDFQRDITARNFAQKDGQEYKYGTKEHMEAIRQTAILAKAIETKEKELRPSLKLMESIQDMVAWKEKGRTKIGRTQRTGSVENSTLIKS